MKLVEREALCGVLGSEMCSPSFDVACQDQCFRYSSIPETWECKAFDDWKAASYLRAFVYNYGHEFTRYPILSFHCIQSCIICLFTVLFIHFILRPTQSHQSFYLAYVDFAVRQAVTPDSIFSSLGKSSSATRICSACPASLSNLEPFLQPVSMTFRLQVILGTYSAISQFIRNSPCASTSRFGSTA